MVFEYPVQSMIPANNGFDNVAPAGAGVTVTVATLDGFVIPLPEQVTLQRQYEVAVNTGVVYVADVAPEMLDQGPVAVVPLCHWQVIPVPDNPVNERFEVLPAHMVATEATAVELGVPEQGEAAIMFTQ